MIHIVATSNYIARGMVTLNLSRTSTRNDATLSLFDQWKTTASEKCVGFLVSQVHHSLKNQQGPITQQRRFI
jgi:hypothetical protein